MKKFIVITAAIMAIMSCKPVNQYNDSQLSRSEKAAIERAKEQHRLDSIARENAMALARKDSINRVTRSKLKQYFTENTDEFSDVVWVKPKSAPQYVNRNGIYCYFARNKTDFTSPNSRAYNFRLVVQYYAEEWLFIRSMIFNIDGENYTFVPDNMKRDCGYGGKIWEWCDESTRFDTALIEKIANAKTVKVKFNGSDYYKVKTLTPEQILSIKRTYEDYKAYDGEL